MIQAQWRFEAPIGDLYMVANEKGLSGIFWKKQPIPLAKWINEEFAEHRILQMAITQLEEYFVGNRKEFEVPLDLVGTAFQKQVWAELLKIPYGKTFSYQEIAIKLKNKGASRAVGSANGKNPVSIIVPCHRVIAGDGTLGGYAGGLPIKTKLLKLEGAKVDY